MMSINETYNGNGQEDISPYQMFLMCIRSPKTIKEHSVKLETFFDFIVNYLGEMEFKTDEIETKCANVLTILAHRSNLPSIDIHSNKLLFFYLHNIDFYLTIIYHYINRKK